MFCPKCGTENPETGKFCRSCGTDLGNVSQALSGKLPKPQKLVDRRGRTMTWESTITTFFMGIAFLLVSLILGATGFGRGWWFWMLIPAFGMIGSGIAKWVQLKKLEQGQTVGLPAIQQNEISPSPASPSLPPPPAADIVPSAESRYKTGDLVPPSVTEGTTRHLKADSEGETMTLPKR